MSLCWDTLGKWYESFSDDRSPESVLMLATDESNCENEN